jgi:hypothetical protein
MGDGDSEQIEALKSVIENLQDSVRQMATTQNKLAGAALAAKEIADAAMAELANTKNELAATKLEMQKTVNESIAPAIKAGMVGFVEEVKKATDERITAILSQQGQPGSDGQPAQGRGAGTWRDLLAEAPALIESIAKAIAAAKTPSQNAGTMAADQVIQGFRIAKLFNNLEVAKTDVESFSKLAHEALDFAPKT